MIEDGLVTIASLLRAHGYRTAMVGKWQLGFAEHGYDQRLAGGPTDRGFERFFGLRASTDIPPYRTIRAANEPPVELHHLSDNLGETRNLAADKPELVARLKQELQRIQHTARTRD